MLQRVVLLSVTLFVNEDKTTLCIHCMYVCTYVCKFICMYNKCKGRTSEQFKMSPITTS